MSPKMIVLDAIAVLAGAVIATLASALFAWLFTDADLATVLGAPGPWIAALVTVGVFAVLYAYLPKTPATLVSLGFGILFPSLLARFAFDSLLPWSAILFLNLVFALVALSVYRFVHANGEARAVAGRLSDRS